MNLIIFNFIVSTYEIGCAPIKLRVPPLPLMKRRCNVKRTIHCGRSFKIFVRFNKLFNPIKKNCTREKYKAIHDRYISCHDCAYDNRKNIQRQDMPPNKPQGFLYFSKYCLHRIHDYFLPVCNQHSIIIIKNTFKIINLDERYFFLVYGEQTIYAIWRQSQGVNPYEL